MGNKLTSPYYVMNVTKLFPIQNLSDYKDLKENRW